MKIFLFLCLIAGSTIYYIQVPAKSLTKLKNQDMLITVGADEEGVCVKEEKKCKKDKDKCSGNNQGNCRLDNWAESCDEQTGYKSVDNGTFKENKELVTYDCSDPDGDGDIDHKYKTGDCHWTTDEEDTNKMVCAEQTDTGTSENDCPGSIGVLK